MAGRLSGTIRSQPWQEYKPHISPGYMVHMPLPAVQWYTKRLSPAHPLCCECMPESQDATVHKMQRALGLAEMR